MNDHICLTTEDIQKIIIAAHQSGMNREYIFKMFIIPARNATEYGISLAIESHGLRGGSDDEPIPDVIIYE